jgi:predicted dehydrogenase
MLLPALKGLNCRLKTIVSSAGVTGTHAAGKFGFEQSSTDSEAVFADPEIDAVFIATPHHTHASLVRKALEAGLFVFVEMVLWLTGGVLEGFGCVSALVLSCDGVELEY